MVAKSGVRLSPMALVLVALAAGLVAGFALSIVHSPRLSAAAALLAPVGTLWVNAIRMTVVPLVVAMLFVGVASVPDTGAVSRAAAVALALFLVLLSLSAAFVSTVGPILFAHLPIDATNADAWRGGGVAPPQNSAAIPSFAQWLIDLAPINPVRAAADGAMLPLVIFTLLFALASTRIQTELRRNLVGFFQAVAESMLVLVRWIIALAPIGVFALSLSLSARVGAAAIGTIGYYILIVCAVTAVQAAALYPLAAVAGGVPMARFGRAALMGQAVGLSSRSSLAALPAMIDGAANRLGLRAEVFGLVLPLAVSTFKFCVPVTTILGALLIARLYGIELTQPKIALLAVSSVLLSFTVPGVPSGPLLIMAPVFASVGLPPEGLGILIALDVLPDAAKTATNVTADLAVATVVSRFMPRERRAE